MNILIAGATGLVGSALLELLSEDPRVTKIYALTRRQIETNAPNVHQIITNFEDDYGSQIPKDTQAVLCCLGTTIKKAGSRAKFRKVDFDYVVDLASVCETMGVPHFGVVSALGANADSKVFYNRVKGEMEAAVKSKDIASISIYQPSLIQGPRQEFRLLEKVSDVALTTMRFLLVGELEQYRPNRSDLIASIMLSGALKQVPGIDVVDSNRMRR